MIQATTLQSNKTGKRTRLVVGFQFGNYLLPRVQYASDVSWKFRQTTSDSAFMVDGAVDIAASKIRAPLALGDFAWSGKYESPTRNSCNAETELAGVFSTAGVWTPLMCYVYDLTEEQCADCGFVSDQPEGIWIWTWAKIEEPRIKSDTEGIIKGHEAVEMKFILREPFMEVDAAHWRFGSLPPTYRARTYREGEQLVSGGNSRVPRHLPPCGDNQRWFFRDPMACVDTSCMCFYQLDCLWGTRNYRLEGNGMFGLPVPGTFEATGYIRADRDSLVRVINDTYFVQEYNLLAGDTLDLVRQEVFSGCTPKNMTITRFPRITPGVNRIEHKGIITLGIKPRWLF